MGSAGSVSDDVPDVIALALPPTWPGAQSRRHDMAAGTALGVSGYHPELLGRRSIATVDDADNDVAAEEDVTNAAAADRSRFASEMHLPPAPEQAGMSKREEEGPSSCARPPPDPHQLVLAPLEWVGSSRAWKETRLAVLDDLGMVSRALSSPFLASPLPLPTPAHDTSIRPPTCTPAHTPTPAHAPTPAHTPTYAVVTSATVAFRSEQRTAPSSTERSLTSQGDI